LIDFQHLLRDNLIEDNFPLSVMPSFYSGPSKDDLIELMAVRTVTDIMQQTTHPQSTRCFRVQPEMLCIQPGNVHHTQRV
jgi:hypothetical protein